ncbi:Uncharacterised protein [Mycobacterium tuberculosis]|nr:Uncharacterised protein [Mycobacterium tuberculosis]SGF72428.1 Uncharacterised protein [Mycobacterium tuberculosis]SGG42061.1 Uncharacterised protein [Mycobacterium tuberculosis]SGI96132.1 Uncharacterised protein [Mycobacterium tuberculosis]SGK42068.1 Uncharacterised protein [Mycobacterium tuberculosis]
MLLLDVSVCIFAIREDSCPNHATYRTWLTRLLTGDGEQTQNRPFCGRVGRFCVCSPSPVSSLVSHVRYVAWLGQLSSRMANMQTLTSRSSIVADQFGEGFLVVQVDTGLQASGAVGRQ